jgi:hypothetical protein
MKPNVPKRRVPVASTYARALEGAHVGFNVVARTLAVRRRADVKGDGRKAFKVPDRRGLRVKALQGGTGERERQVGRPGRPNVDDLTWAELDSAGNGRRGNRPATPCFRAVVVVRRGVAGHHDGSVERGAGGTPDHTTPREPRLDHRPDPRRLACRLQGCKRRSTLGHRWRRAAELQPAVAQARTTINDLLDAARRRLDRMSPAQALAAMHEGAVLVDIRCEAQRERDGVIPGAVLHPRNALDWRVDPASGHSDPRVNGDLNRRIIVVCDEG